MGLLTNYVGVIVPSFNLFDLVELVLRLLIDNAPKSNSIPGLQTVWKEKRTRKTPNTDTFHITQPNSNNL